MSVVLGEMPGWRERLCMCGHFDNSHRYGYGYDDTSPCKFSQCSCPKFRLSEKERVR